MTDEITNLGTEAHRVLKKAANVIDSKLPQAQRAGVLTS
jgi:hypothetical protein